MSERGGRPSVAFVTVQFRNFEDTVALARNIASLNDANDAELAVVDNAPGATSREAVARLRADSPVLRTWLEAPSNLYYWGGAAFALTAMTQGRRPADWTVICNNDVTFDTDFIRGLKLLDIETEPVVAPRIVSSATGLQQNPLLETIPGPLKRLKWRIYDLGFGSARALLAIKRVVPAPFARPTVRDGNASRPRKVYAAHGACVALSASFFRRGGALDTTVPLFAEELTLAADAERLGLDVWFRPELRVVHREHSTTGLALTRAKYEMERMARRHYYALTGKSGQ